MSCNHEKLRCTNNRFFCLICGQEIQKAKSVPQAEVKEPEKEVKKTARKRKE
jgi:hypothetical protein